MKFELLLFGLTAFFIINVYHDGKYLQMLKSYKKYYQMASIAFVGISAYVFLRKYPTQSRSLFSHANGIIKYLPIDKEAGDLLSPLFSMANDGASPQEKRMLNSGQGQGQGQGGGQGQGQGPAGATKRCVSETKKKYVAAQQGWACGECKKQLPAWFEVDHKMRLDKGGSNHITNLVALCRDCHGKKTAFENF